MVIEGENQAVRVQVDAPYFLSADPRDRICSEQAYVLDQVDTGYRLQQAEKLASLHWATEGPAGTIWAAWAVLDD